MPSAVGWLVAHSTQLDALAHFVVLVGVPTGLLQFFLKVRKEQRDREYGTYNALDEKYVEFQRLCLDHPRLDVFDVPDAQPVDLNPEEKKKELIAFTLLISIFERSYLMYKDQPRKVRDQQWSGWHEYMVSYCRRDNFRQAWRISGHTFAKKFQEHMATMIRDTASEDS